MLSYYRNHESNPFERDGTNWDSPVHALFCCLAVDKNIERNLRVKRQFLPTSKEYFQKPVY